MAVSTTSLQKWILLLLHMLIYSLVHAQQSAAGQDTLIAVVGRDYVMMGADSSSSGGGGIALTSSNIDKLAVIHDGFGDDSVIGGCTELYDVYRRDSLKQQAIVVGFAGNAADADRLIGTLRAHTQIRELESGIGHDTLCVFDGQSKQSKQLQNIISPAGLDSESIAHLARSEIASKLRSRQPLQLCLLVGGIVRCDERLVSSSGTKSLSFSERVQKQVISGSESHNTRNKKDEIAQREQSESAVLSSDAQHNSESNPLLVPKLYWLDQYGSLQNLRYGAHGYGSNFALSILDQRYQSDMSRKEAIDLICECFRQLRQRYVINSPEKPRIKCVDVFGVREFNEKEIA